VTADLLVATADLVDIASVSRAEQALVGHLEERLRALDHLEVVRVGDNLVARTALGRSRRVVLGGHTDTVPPDGNAHAVIDGDTLSGVGSADMKGGLAVMMHLAETVATPAVDVTWVLYAREEIEIRHNGLRELAAARPDLLRADFAVLGEPTDGVIEGGCQGTLRVDVTVRGARAHTARAWMGTNAIHRLGAVLDMIGAVECRRPVVEGLEYREALQAVAVTGGVAGNVVPDAATVTVAHRFAPDRSVEEALSWVHERLADVLAEGDTVELVEAAPAARPGLDHPLVADWIDRTGLATRAKLGWTDVAFFSEQGVPAVNLGPGDPTVAHTASEHVTRASLERTHAVLADLLTHS
jgi:succinyl-diaminopimelate desuccinylase